MTFHKSVVHIGLHKTGTTYLQTNIFPAIDDYNTVRGWNSVRDAIKTDKDNFIVSDESISGSLLGGNYRSSFYNNLKKINNLYNKPKIIVGFRKQSQFVFSIYKQYLHQGGWKEFDYMFNLNNDGLIKFEDLFYEEKIVFLKENFKNVFIYTQESLLCSQDKFLNGLYEFLEIDSSDVNTVNTNEVNVGIKTDIQFKTLKKLNKVNETIKKMPLIPSMNSKPFVKLRLTPRDVAQYRLRKIKSPKYKMQEDVNNFLNEEYKDDWEFVLNNLSY